MKKKQQKRKRRDREFGDRADSKETESEKETGSLENKLSEEKEEEDTSRLLGEAGSTGPGAVLRPAAGRRPRYLCLTGSL